MLELSQVEVISFDCYGTLIDWETGILGALRPMLAERGIELSDEDLLETYAELESGIESGPHKRYADILREVVDGFGRWFGFAPAPDEREALVASLPGWQPFADTIDALRELKQHARLAIISNVDDDLFAATRDRLGVDFDWVVTAEQVGAYKPSHRNFELARERFAVAPGHWLHAAQSLFHDIAPCRALGIPCVWVNRRIGKVGQGAGRAVDVTPDLEVPDLRALAEQFTRGGLIEGAR